MILAKARFIEGGKGRVKVALSFPTGFDPEEVIEESVVANGTVSPEAVHVKPRRGNFDDLYREFEVSFASEAIQRGAETDGTLRITGKFRRGLKFAASLASVPPSQTDH